MARRLGGREARKALRSAPLAEDIKPVHPGELGGAYKPLSEEGILEVEANIYRILSEVASTKPRHIVSRLVLLLEPYSVKMVGYGFRER